MTILLLLVGLGLIVLGADWLVDGASAIARKAGVSEFVIGLTIVGFGTSCPELVVSLGCSSVITPLSFAGMSPVDAAVLILSSALLLLWAFTGKKCRIDRWEGVVMLLVFAAYYYYLFTTL